MSFHGTTIICVRKEGSMAMAGDGQVTLGNTIMKGTATKVHRIYNGNILVGFAGATADAFTLKDKFEAKIKEYGGDLTRASVELAKEWRTNKMLSKLEAMLLVADKQKMFLISGTGDVIDPERDVIAIGSGGMYAYSAALAYLDGDNNLTASQIARKSMEIASQVCIYTNNNFVVEEL